MKTDTPEPPRTTMNGKPVHTVPAKSVINFKSDFRKKLLCDGLTFSTGSACAYSCTFCYVPDLMRKSPHMAEIARPLEEVVIRRADALKILQDQLLDSKGRPRFTDPQDTRVIYASPLVDVAANLTLARETILACHFILSHTPWHIRLLSKSNLLPEIAHALEAHRDRVIYGVSTGTLDDHLAAAFEKGTARVSKRLQSLHWLQDRGFRTFGMLCPTLPQVDGYQGSWAADLAHAIRYEKCEHVWAEVLNVRGDSMVRTCAALHQAGYTREARLLMTISSDKAQWEQHARFTFMAHTRIGYAPGQLRFLQYVTKDSLPWWQKHIPDGAVLLGAAAPEA